MSPMEATQKRWQAASAILLVVSVFWLVPALAVALLRVPHSRDSARRCFAWLKLALFFMTAGVVLLVAGATPTSLGTTFGLTISDDLAESLNQCRAVGYLLYQVAVVFALPMLLEATLAVLYDWELIESSTPLLQTVANAFVGIEVVFAIVVFIFVEINDLDYATLNNRQPGDVMPYLRLLAAFDVFLWMASAGMAFHSAFLVLLARRRPNHQKATRLLCVACVFWLTRNTWAIAADATWTLPGKPRPGTYDVALDVVFSYWAQLGCLGLLCLLGQKRTTGLWRAPSLSPSSASASASAPRYHHACTRPPYQDPSTRPLVAYAGAPAPEPCHGFGRPAAYPGWGQARAHGAAGAASPRPPSSLASPVWPLPPLPPLPAFHGARGSVRGSGAPSPSASVRVSDGGGAPSCCGRSVCRTPSQSSLLGACRSTAAAAARRAPSAAHSVDSAPRSLLRRHQSLDRFLEQNRLGVSLANEVYSVPKRL